MSFRRATDHDLGTVYAEYLSAVHSSHDPNSAERRGGLVAAEAEREAGQGDEVAIRQRTPLARHQRGAIHGRLGVVCGHLQHEAGVVLPFYADVMGGDSVVADPERVRPGSAERHHRDAEGVLPVALRVKLPDERRAVRGCAQWSWLLIVRGRVKPAYVL